MDLDELIRIVVYNFAQVRQSLTDLRQDVNRLVSALNEDDEEPKQRRRHLTIVAPLVVVAVVGLMGLAVWALFGRSPEIHRVAGPTSTIVRHETATITHVRAPHSPPHKTSEPSASAAPGTEGSDLSERPAVQTSQPDVRAPDQKQRSADRVTRPEHSEPESTASAEPPLEPQIPQRTCLLTVGALGIDVCV